MALILMLVYRGIIYSDKLKEAEAFMGIQVALEDLTAYICGKMTLKTDLRMLLLLQD